MPRLFVLLLLMVVPLLAGCRPEPPPFSKHRGASVPRGPVGPHVPEPWEREVLQRVAAARRQEQAARGAQAWQEDLAAVRLQVVPAPQPHQGPTVVPAGVNVAPTLEPAPEILEVHACATGIDVLWNHAGAPASGFELQVSEDGGATWHPGEWFGAGEAHGICRRLSSGVPCHFRIRAYTATGPTQWSAAAGPYYPTGKP